MCEHSSIEAEVLEYIKPRKSDYEYVERVVSKALKLIGEVLSEGGFTSYEVRIEGSYAKDTWLRGELDVDIFVLFEKDDCLGSVSVFVDKTVPAFLRRGVKVELRHAQHPYVRLLVDDLWMELVPGCLVDDPDNVITAVDRTPFHTEYVKSRLTSEQRDEVRLLKSFAKGIGVYGAEVGVKGFSGYLLELLVAKYGCFRDVLRAASSWKPPVIIDLGGTDLSVLFEKYPDSVMFVPDPVDPDRNVAASVSPRSLASFCLASLMYMRGPSRRFFHVYKPSPPSRLAWVMGARLENIVAVLFRLERPESPSNVWGLASRMARVVSSLLTSHGFKVVDVRPFVNSENSVVLVVVELESSKRSYVLREGPSVWDPERSLRFVEKYLTRSDVFGPWIDDEGKLKVLIRPKHITAAFLLRERLEAVLPASMRKRVKSVSVLEGLEAMEAAEAVDPGWAAIFALKRPHWLGDG